jgi:hypothetical protein
MPVGFCLGPKHFGIFFKPEPGPEAKRPGVFPCVVVACWGQTPQPQPGEAGYGRQGGSVPQGDPCPKSGSLRPDFGFRKPDPEPEAKRPKFFLRGRGLLVPSSPTRWAMRSPIFWFWAAGVRHRPQGDNPPPPYSTATYILVLMSVTVIRVGPPRHFIHIHITTPIVSALKNYYI